MTLTPENTYFSLRDQQSLYCSHNWKIPTFSVPSNVNLQQNRSPNKCSFYPQIFLGPLIFSLPSVLRSFKSYFSSSFQAIFNAEFLFLILVTFTSNLTIISYVILAITDELHKFCRTRWPCGLRNRSVAARLLGSWVRFPRGLEFSSLVFVV